MCAHSCMQADIQLSLVFNYIYTWDDYMLKLRKMYIKICLYMYVWHIILWHLFIKIYIYIYIYCNIIYMDACKYSHCAYSFTCALISLQYCLSKNKCCCVSVMFSTSNLLLQFILTAVRVPWQHVSCNEEIIKGPSGMFQPWKICRHVWS